MGLATTVGDGVGEEGTAATVALGPSPATVGCGVGDGVAEEPHPATTSASVISAIAQNIKGLIFFKSPSSNAIHQVIRLTALFDFVETLIDGRVQRGQVGGKKMCERQDVNKAE